MSNPLTVAKSKQDPVNTKLYDLVIVGGGFRTTTFLSSAPELLERDILIIEKGNSIGPGSFEDYDITTSSNGASMLKNTSYKGAFNQIRNNEKINRIINSNHPVEARDLSSALIEIGNMIVNKLSKESILYNTNVVKVEINSSTGPNNIITSEGNVIRANHILLATGRTERLHPSLNKWKEKVMFSGNAISLNKQEYLKNKLIELNGKSIVIPGCSHSTMSVLKVILKLIKQLQLKSDSFIVPKIYVLQRSLAKLMYTSEEEATKNQVEGREQLYNPKSDICPDTGIIFRDSGLRHISKEIYCDLWSNKISNAEIIRIQEILDASNLFDEAGLIIQALGYYGNPPEVSIYGETIHSKESENRIYSEDDGTIEFNGMTLQNLSALRLEPTPLNRKDNTVYGKNLYKALYQRIEHHISSIQKINKSED
ncbi:hypothetical protein [Bacillus sp. R86525]|uniref:hypothetical protein n=1 Tax=Bacillus sp. R86525 TaxID=3101709 RepID=UPI0036717174